MRNKYTVFCNSFIFLIGSIIAVSLYAQTPGYLGMRHSIMGEISAMPSIFEKNSTINTTFTGRYQFILSRNITIGAMYQSYSTQMGYVSPLTNRVGRANIEGWALGLNVRWFNFFKLGVIAPLGPYQQFEINYGKYQITDRFGRYYAFPDNVIGKDMGAKRQISIGFSIGMQRIVQKYVTFHYGIRSSYVLPIDLDNLESKYIEGISNRRMRNFSAIMLTGGIGVLIF